MASDQLNSAFIRIYEDSFRRIAHQLVVWGHQDASGEINSESVEEEITGLIVEAIRDRLDTEEGFDRYSVAEEVPLAIEGRVGKQRRRLDIVLESSHSQPRPRYIFEAKRLKKNSFAIGRYVGDEGMLCFVLGIYAAHYIEAAMLGYVQSDTVSYWSQELKRRFDSDEKNDMRVSKALKKVQVKGCPDILVSEHERKGNASITLCHLFVDCS